MSSDHRRRDRFATALVLITLGGLAWRVAYVVWLRNRGVLGDGYVFHTGALDLVNGVGFYDPVSGAAVAGHPPAWLVVLAAPSVLGLKSWLSHQLFTCLIGAATIVMTGLAGRAAFGRRVGIIAAALAAVYPFIWVYEREVLSEPLAMLETATAIWLAYRFRARPGLGLAAALGAVVGVMAMTRSELIAVAVLLVLPLIWSVRDTDLRNRFGRLAVAGVACVLVIAPWAIYNSTRFQKQVPFSTGFGIAMYTGNCAPVYHGPMLGYADLGCAAFVPKVSLDYSVADGQYRHQALKFMSKNKSRVPIVVAARLGRTFGFFRPAQQMHIEAQERRSPLWVFQLGFVEYWIMLPFAIAGVVITRRRRIPVYPLLVFVAVVLLAVIPTIGSPRYRAPAEITLVLLAAVGIEAAIGAVRRRSEPSGRGISAII
jgi:4-amino-4-deoxy-L-arabinose transferase-like glycosyltransferase